MGSIFIKSKICSGDLCSVMELHSFCNVWSFQVFNFLHCKFSKKSMLFFSSHYSVFFLL